MGMSNMQVQKPMQQGSGKGMGGMPPQGGFQMPPNNGAFQGGGADLGIMASQMAGLQGQPPLQDQLNNYNQSMPISQAGQPNQTDAPMGQMDIQAAGPQMQQPSFGQPNMYSNTVGNQNNAPMQSQQRQGAGAKGKGA
jgi:hypothetical protein